MMRKNKKGRLRRRSLLIQSEAINDARRYLKLTPYDQILSKIKSSFESRLTKAELIRVDYSTGRVAAEDVFSGASIPPRTNSAMDGYAIRHRDLKSASLDAPGTFVVKGSIFPNHFEERMPCLGAGETYYVATGAPLPVGADTIVRVEEALLKDKTILLKHDVKRGKNIAFQGEDIRKGQLVVRNGQIMNPIDVALLIGTGKKKIKVYAIPKVGLLSVGDELAEFDPDARIKSGEKRTVNNYLNLLSGFVEQFGCKPVSLGICGDETVHIRKRVSAGLKNSDMILTISGSSVGRHDNVLDAVTSIPYARNLFHGTRVVPIRPAGVLTVRNKPIVIVPGHAVSAVLTFYAIVLPILNLISGLPQSARQSFVNAVAANILSNDRSIEALALVQLHYERSQGKFIATGLDWGSNLLSNLSRSDGFVWLQPRSVMNPGQEIEVQVFDGFTLRTDGRVF
jgi:molybdopterin molybdotransferase